MKVIQNPKKTPNWKLFPKSGSFFLDQSKTNYLCTVWTLNDVLGDIYLAVLVSRVWAESFNNHNWDMIDILLPKKISFCQKRYHIPDKKDNYLKKRISIWQKGYISPRISLKVRTVHISVVIVETLSSYPGD